MSYREKSRPIHSRIRSRLGAAFALLGLLGLGSDAAQGQPPDRGLETWPCDDRAYIAIQGPSLPNPGLYWHDRHTGKLILFHNWTTGLNGLALDPETGRMFGLSDGVRLDVYEAGYDGAQINIGRIGPSLPHPQAGTGGEGCEYNAGVFGENGDYYVGCYASDLLATPTEPAGRKYVLVVDPYVSPPRIKRFFTTQWVDGTVGEPPVLGDLLFDPVTKNLITIDESSAYYIEIDSTNGDSRAIGPVTGPRVLGGLWNYADGKMFGYGSRWPATSFNQDRLWEIPPSRIAIEGAVGPRGNAVDATSCRAAPSNLCEISPSNPDGDGDGIPDNCDNCPTVANSDQDPTDPDTDGDGVPDTCDVCPGGDDAVDSDGDGVPDACDVCPGSDDGVDADGDGVPDGCDICPLGDDSVDTDGDGVPDACDACPGADDSADADGDGVPDGCDACPGGDDNLDGDGDGVPDACDNCPSVANAGQEDADADGVGDACDVCPAGDDNLDADNDGVPDACDVCPGSDDTLDSDGDGVPDGCDICPSGDDTVDSDGDGVPDACDACPGADDGMDSDNDGVPDGCDACPGSDDGVDTDGDGVPDGCDVCAAGDDNLDSDGDGVPNACDTCSGDDTVDSDGDGVPDACDICPGFDDAADADGDGIPDGCDTCSGDDGADGDGDGVPDACDLCPGSDDGLDADGDGVPDGCDRCAAGDDSADGDGDGVADACDNCPDVSNPGQEDENGDGEGDACEQPPVPTEGLSIEPLADGSGFALDVEVLPGVVSYTWADELGTERELPVDRKIGERQRFEIETPLAAEDLVFVARHETGDRWTLRFPGENVEEPTQLATAKPRPLSPFGKADVSSGEIPDITGADYIIVGPADFRPVARKLIRYRESQGRVGVFLPAEELQPEGWDLAAWRDLGKRIEAEAPDGGVAVLLLGDGADPLLRPAVIDGTYGPTPSDLHLFDRKGKPGFSVGRLPIHNVRQGRRYLKNVKAYERREEPGRVLLVGDAPDGLQDFTRAVEDLEAIYPGTEDALTFPSPEEWALMDGNERWSKKRELRIFFARRTKTPRPVIQFLGHSSMRSVGRPPYFSIDRLPELKAAPSVWLIAACAAGTSDVPGIDAIGEHLLFSKRSRAVGVVGATTLTEYRSARKLNRYLAEEVGSGGTVGEQFARALRRLRRAEARSPYILLGDPLVRIPLHEAPADPPSLH